MLITYVKRSRVPIPPQGDDNVWQSQGNDIDGWKPPQPWMVAQPMPYTIDEDVLPQMTVVAGPALGSLALAGVGL